MTRLDRFEDRELKKGSVCGGLVRKGFTLVEIMIVVALITILGAIVVPNAIKYRNESQAVLCVSNLKQIQLAKEHWVMMNGWVPEMTDIAGGLDKFIKTSPVCAAGGSYDLGTDSESPSCSIGMKLDKTGNNKSLWHTLSTVGS